MDEKIIKTTAEIVVIPALKILKIRFPQEYINYILNEKWEADPIPSELKWQEIKKQFSSLFNTVSTN